jgi:hypothetical protein
MHFGMKITLKNNHNYTFKQELAQEKTSFTLVN